MNAKKYSSSTSRTSTKSYSILKHSSTPKTNRQKLKITCGKSQKDSLVDWKAKSKNSTRSSEKIRRGSMIYR